MGTMSTKSGIVSLLSIHPTEYDDFFIQYSKYSDELEPHKARRNQKEMVLYREAVTEELGEGSNRELFWIMEGDLRAGFVMTRCFPDWPDESILIGSISEFYIFVLGRRRGIGTKAVSIAITNLHLKGAEVIEADVLYSNEHALTFWKSLGFNIEFFGTSRRL